MVLASLAFVAALLMSCASERSGLVGTTWILEHEGDSGGLLQPEVTVDFKDSGEVTGFYSHLNYKGLYEVEDQHLTIDDICWLSLVCQAETNMSGPEDYIEALMNAERYSIDGDRLTVYAGEEVLTYYPGE